MLYIGIQHIPVLLQSKAQINLSIMESEGERIQSNDRLTMCLTISNHSSIFDSLFDIKNNISFQKNNLLRWINGIFVKKTIIVTQREEHGDQITYHFAFDPVLGENIHKETTYLLELFKVETSQRVKVDIELPTANIQIPSAVKNMALKIIAYWFPDLFQNMFFLMMKGRNEGSLEFDFRTIVNLQEYCIKQENQKDIEILAVILNQNLVLEFKLGEYIDLRVNLQSIQ